MKAARWTEEQLSRHVAKTNRLPVAAGIGRGAVSAPRGLRLSNERLEGIAEYLFQIQAAGLEMPEFEFQFHETRRWRSDFVWRDHKLLAEYEGGVYKNGRHVRGSGYEDDCEKYNEATLLGFRLLRFTYDMVRSGMALEQTERALSTDV
jgi:very-short-patch-repair endonuclease